MTRHGAIVSAHFSPSNRRERIRMNASLQGRLLIAMPSLHDPNFFHAVILLCRHDEDGALGVVVNRPLRTTVREAWQQISKDSCACDDPLYQGGPCPGPVMVLHTLPNEADAMVCPGIYLTMNGDTIQSLVRQKMNAIKYLVGNAGWSAGQLEREISEAAWLVAEASPKEVFHSPGDQWLNLARTVSLPASAQHLKPGIIPPDPALN
ncbi:MAG: YqgE/AlgH family protein [Phycisphaerae bacterium]